MLEWLFQPAMVEKLLLTRQKEGGTRVSAMDQNELSRRKGKLHSC